MSKDFRTGYSSYPLGIRNNNPGNLRPIDGVTWKGQASIVNNFLVFENLTYGLRALATDLTNKYNRGLDTITKIISVYAPPSENNTAAYITAVSNATGIGADTKLSLTKDTLLRFMRAIINHECGPDTSKISAIISDSDIQAGIDAMAPALLLKIQGFSQPTR